jgi:hypothetical protein
MNPDYMIEKFWLDFKQSMINFYQSTNIPTRPITHWSNDLNTLQSLKQYIEIKSNIDNYITLYIIDVMRNQSYYYTGILATNIKRWEILTDEYTTINNIVYILFDIYFMLLKKANPEEVAEINMIFCTFELYILLNNYNTLIQYGVDYNKPSILDKLKQKIDIIHNIKTLYGVDININMSGKKIINMIKNEN